MDADFPSPTLDVVLERFPVLRFVVPFALPAAVVPAEAEVFDANGSVDLALVSLWNSTSVLEDGR